MTRSFTVHGPWRYVVRRQATPGPAVAEGPGVRTIFFAVIYDESNEKPSWCWDSQPSVGIFGNFFLIFGSNTPTWSVENQLNLWSTNCVVNQTGYFGPLYASKHQTSLWRHQHIYSVQLPQTGWLSGRVSDLRSKGRRFEPRP